MPGSHVLPYYSKLLLFIIDALIISGSRLSGQDSRNVTPYILIHRKEGERAAQRIPRCGRKGVTANAPLPFNLANVGIVFDFIGLVDVVARDGADKVFSLIGS